MTEKKIALVTGANKDLGFETSRQLAQLGITVLMGARDENRGKAAAEKLQAGLGQIKPFAYDASKTAVNHFTVHLAAHLKDTPVKVNAAHPGRVKTDLGGEEAPMEIVDGAKTGVALSTLDNDGPTGGFFHMGEQYRGRCKIEEGYCQGMFWMAWTIKG